MARSFKMAVVCSALSVLILSCGEQSTNPFPDAPAPLGEILDAVHGNGNQDFFFLPPLVSDPSGNPAFDADAFDGSLAPVVQICLLGADGCDDAQPDLFPITYTMDTGPGSETIRLDPDAEDYIVNWHTDEFGLDADATYRIRVLVAGTELGHADVDVVDSGRELRNVNTNEYVPLNDDRTLPIKFRIEQGAVYVVGTDGGTVVAQDGAVTLVVPERDAPIGITVQPATGLPDTPNLVAGTAFDLGPEGTAFDPPATLTIRYDPQNLPANTVPRLHHLVNGVWERVAGATADLAAHTVSGPVTGFSAWAVLGTGPVLTVHITGGRGQVVVQGTTLDPCRYDAEPCSADFTLNQNLTLEAQTLGSDPHFEGWSGSGAPSTCTTDPLCSITMDQDRDITATFSMPGLVGLSTYDTSFTAVQSGPGSPSSAQIVVSNIGGRDLELQPVQVYNDQDVPHWLDASITSQTVTTASPETLTVSVAANPLPPGTYGAHVLVTDGYFSGVLAVTLTVTPTTSYTYNGTGHDFGPRPLSVAIFTNSSGTDIYPVGSDVEYLFVLFDTGSDIVYLSSADATFLNIGAASPTNPNQDTRVRLDGLSVIDPTALTAPIGAHGTAGGAQAEVTGIRVGPASPPQRPDLNASLIGAPVANEVLALIDNTTTVTRGPYAFCGCNATGPDITFFMPTDAGIPTPDLQLPLERFGSTSPSLLDNATNGQKYFLNQVLFRNGGQAVMHDPAATQPFTFWFDTGAPETIIDTRLATELGIDLSTAGSFDCFQGTGKAGNEGYVIDQIEFVGATASGAGSYIINNAAVCVDIRSQELRQYYTDPANPGTPILVDAQIGANLFTHVPILFDGKGNKLGIVVP